MSLEKNKDIVRKMYEAVNKRKLDLLGEFIAPDYIDHTEHLRSLEEVKKFLSTLIKSLDFQITIEDIIAEGDKVWVRYTLTGTHIGDFFGLAPTGKKFTESVVYIFRIVNFKIVESLQVSNPLDLLMQIGALEYTEKRNKLLPKEVK